MKRKTCRISTGFFFFDFTFFYRKPTWILLNSGVVGFIMSLNKKHSKKSQKGISKMLELQNVKKAFNGNEILKGISLNVEDGEIISILGPSGSGKTTLLNLILGITDIDSGKLIYNGEDRQRFRWNGVDLILYFRTMPCFQI